MTLLDRSYQPDLRWKNLECVGEFAEGVDGGVRVAPRLNVRDRVLAHTRRRSQVVLSQLAIASPFPQSQFLHTGRNIPVRVKPVNLLFPFSGSFIHAKANAMQINHLPPSARLQFFDVKLSECVQAWLEHTGRSQTDIAGRAKLSVPKFNEIVKGHNPNPRWGTVEKIAAGFGMPMVQFLAGPQTTQTESASTDEIVRAGRTREKVEGADLLRQSARVDSASKLESSAHGPSRTSPSDLVATAAITAQATVAEIGVQLGRLHAALGTIHAAAASDADDDRRSTTGTPATQAGASPVRREPRSRARR
jgi:transcriptional regulator with XRE-family HTH domain